MKKCKLLLAAIMLLMASGAFAQIKVGIKAGGNLSTLTNLPNVSGLFETKMKFGIHAGCFLEFIFNENLSLQPELLYSTQGAVFTIPYASASLKQSFSFDYLNLPVLLKINLVKIAKGLSIEVGPQIGYLVSAGIDMEIFNSETKQKLPYVNTKYNGHDIDVTILAGLSYTFAENFVVSARYGLGLTTVEKGDREPVSLVNSKNSVIQLSVGYKF